MKLIFAFRPLELFTKEFHNLVPQSLVAPSLPLESSEAKSSQAVVYCYVHNSLTSNIGMEILHDIDIAILSWMALM